MNEPIHGPTISKYFHKYENTVELKKPVGRPPLPKSIEPKKPVGRPPLPKSSEPVAEIIQKTVQVAIPIEKKISLPKKVKSDVWNYYIGADLNAHRCLCCKKTRIQIMDFQVGHVQSEKEGGTLEIGNLRPICSACNFAMGTTNMIEFVKKYGYYIG
jgi:hypothetical protein